MNAWGVSATRAGLQPRVHRDIDLAVGDHTFTPYDSRDENWGGGTWWITKKRLSTKVSATVEWFAMGQEMARATAILARRATARRLLVVEAVRTESENHKFTVPAPDNLSRVRPRLWPARQIPILACIATSSLYRPELLLPLWGVGIAQATT